jgi:hypothetical protein
LPLLKHSKPQIRKKKIHKIEIKQEKSKPKLKYLEGKQNKVKKIPI